MQYTDETDLAEVIKSPRAIGALRKAGILTVGEVRRKPIAELGRIPGVGDYTLEVVRGLQGAAVAPDAEDPMVVEECESPIQLMSPYPSFAMTMLPAGRMADGSGRGYVTQRPLVIRFSDGRAELTQDQYLTMKFNRDTKAVLAAKTAKQPWRQEAVEWLRTRRQHGIGYHIMTD